ncbi:MAG: hypothetical protein V3S22_02545 [Candidatus Neomarinimicrobiota bacterium]
MKLNPLSIFTVLIFTTQVNAQEFSIYILHTNNTNGALENCYCPDHPLGALEKRAVLVNRFIKENPNTILVDSGDLFTLTNRDFKDSLVVEAYKLMPYDAILPGDQELVREEKELNALLSVTGATLVGTNLDNKISGLVPYKIVERNGVKIAILGVLDAYALKYYPQDIKDRIILRDPVEAVIETLELLNDKADIFLVLTHQGTDLDVEFARQIDGLDIIIGAHSQTLIRNPEKVNKAFIFQAGKDGYYVGIIEMKMNGKELLSTTARVEALTLEMPDDPRIMSMITEYEQRTGNINHRKLQILKGE